MITQSIRQRIGALCAELAVLARGKESLLALVDEAETPENVYNSNAIENSTLTLRETEEILLGKELSRDVLVREVLEAKNLERVIAHKRSKVEQDPLSEQLILSLHNILLSGIDDFIAGRFRQSGEYVRVGTHIAPPPKYVVPMIAEILFAYADDLDGYCLDQIAKFHLDFETIHPFCDGNGRTGRVIINFQLLQSGFPRVIIRNEQKQNYYAAFGDYREKDATETMEKILTLAVTESLHKRIAHLQGATIIRLSDYVKQNRLSAPALAIAAHRQTIPAFREKEIWKIAQDYMAPNEQE